MSDAAGRPANRLAKEKSPYLLQHAHNPVDWRPWDDAALAEAKASGRPIFLSVGYSTCHWCHVMERESFESAEIAAILNAGYVPIKVDREERPDVDALYMEYVQAATGRGGWPMSVLLTPDLRPFWGGTYLPRNEFGRLLTQVGALWKDDRDRITTAGAEALRMLSSPGEAAEPDPDRTRMRRHIEAGASAFTSGYDRVHGGFGGAPKFPRPATLGFLLRAGRLFNAPPLTEMTVATLRAMADGGMHDQLGGGFHRYSVDERWHVPHFEKMLYDQAQLVASYVEAFQITRDARLDETARDVCEYVLRDLTAPDGGFRSAEDADSAPDADHPHDKREGAFYVWTATELETALGADADAFMNAYGARPDGNVLSDPHDEFGNANVLYRAETDPAVVARRGPARAKQMTLRDRRPRPHLDDKILTAWNGLMIGALARAGGALGEPRFTRAAERAAEFILTRLIRNDGTLLRRWRDGEAAIPAFLDDHAFLIAGLLDLHEATGTARWLDAALTLQAEQDKRFLDRDAKGRPAGYFTSPAGDPHLLARRKDSYDGAEPAANSVTAHNLLRLASLTGVSTRTRDAEAHLAWASARLDAGGYGQPWLLAAFAERLLPHRQAVLAGDPASPGVALLRRELTTRFLPGLSIIHADGGAGQAALAKSLPFLKTLGPVNGQPACYLCVDHTCDLPVTDPAALAKLLDR